MVKDYLNAQHLLVALLIFRLLLHRGLRLVSYYQGEVLKVFNLVEIWHFFPVTVLEVRSFLPCTSMTYLSGSEIMHF